MAGNRRKLLLVLLLGLPAWSMPACPAQARTMDIRADYLRHERKARHLTARGRVEVNYQGSLLAADEMHVDTATDRLRALGNVRIEEAGRIIYGESMDYDAAGESFIVRKPRGATESKGVEGLIYFDGEYAMGNRDRIMLHNAAFNTCGPYCPRDEYMIKAKRITIFTDVKVVAKQVSVHIGSERVLWLPMLVVSLKDEPDFLPKVGYNKEEGYYIKTKYAYMAREGILAYAILDYMSRKGTGYGLEQRYTIPSVGAGRSEFFSMDEKDTGRKTARTLVQQAFAVGGTVRGNFNYNERDTYTSTGGRTNTLTTSLALTRNVPRGATSLNYSLSENRAAARSSNATMNFTANRRFARTLTGAFNLRFSEAKHGTGQARQQMNTVWTFTGNTRRYNWNLVWSERHDPDGTLRESGQYYMNKTPELNVNLTPVWFRGFVPGFIPFQINTMRLVYAEYEEGPKAREFTSSKWEASLAGAKSLTPLAGMTLTFNENFTQTVFKTGDLRYTINHNYTLRQVFSRKANLTLQYAELDSEGGNPFRGASNPSSANATARLNIANKQKWSWAFATSYNYKIGRYGPLSITYNVVPANRTTLTLSTSRDLESHVWRPLVSNYAYTGDKFRLTLRSTYNLEDNRVHSHDLLVAWSAGSGWKLQARGSHQQRQRRPFFTDMILTKRNCCTELGFVWRERTDEFFFTYTILALPRKPIGLASGPDGLIFQSAFLDKIYNPEFGAGGGN